MIKCLAFTFIANVIYTGILHWFLQIYKFARWFSAWDHLKYDIQLLNASSSLKKRLYCTAWRLVVCLRHRRTSQPADDERTSQINSAAQQVALASNAQVWAQMIKEENEKSTTKGTACSQSFSECSPMFLDLLPKRLDEPFTRAFQKPSKSVLIAVEWWSDWYRKPNGTWIGWKLLELANWQA